LLFDGHLLLKVLIFPIFFVLRTMPGISDNAFLRVVPQIKYFSGGRPAFIAIDIVVFSFHSHIQVHFHILPVIFMQFFCWSRCW
jgi:hypothetical protein